MKNKIMKFIDEMFGTLRGVCLENQPWLYAVDVCKALEIKNPRDAVSRLEADEKCSFVDSRRRVKNGVTNSVDSGDGSNGAVRGWVENRVNLINEQGLYRLIFTSRTEKAREFQRWVFHRVLPALRREALWLEIRQDVKDTRLELTDEIKKFIEYLKATDQLDRPEKVWYFAFSKLVNKVVGVNEKRDNLTYLQLLRIQDCEDKIISILEKGMENKLTHHEIWLDVKNKLNAE